MKKIKIPKESLKFRPFEEFFKELYPTKKAREEADIRFARLALGYDIFVARKKKKLTQKALAKKIDTTQSVVARIEKGDQNITLDNLSKIAKILNKEFKISPGRNK